MTSRIVSPHGLFAILSLAAALAAGCQPKAREPRRLPFPTFQAEAPFPEFQIEEGSAPRDRASLPSQFARDLNGRSEGVAPSAPEGRSVPLGNAMTAQIPNQEGWTWSLDAGATLITYAPRSGRPGALIYVEAFSPELHSHPSAEHLRFQMTVDPGLAESSLRFSSTRRWSQLLTTRTSGHGLGFRATRGTFTGWRWVGHNAQRVTLRCGRYLGVWAAPRPLPPPLAEALARLRGNAERPAPRPAVTPVSAYLILGSATDPGEETGVHFALLCVREPRCLVSEELSKFLASIQVSEGSLLERLRSAPPVSFENLVQDSGLEIMPGARFTG
ncbi:MAG TPA: hypothetical protein VJ725_14445 [Thermoanaerobaculia bacterium]|nr:hypothetical protein [Thermoanaerobaculia bacterium]